MVKRGPHGRPQASEHEPFCGGKRTILVGHRENVFNYLPEIEFVETWPQALDALGPALRGWGGGTTLDAVHVTPRNSIGETGIDKTSRRVLSRQTSQS
jgi:hypothetical protein